MAYRQQVYMNVPDISDEDPGHGTSIFPTIFIPAIVVK